MAFQEVADLSADTTISLGGVNKKTGKANPSKVEGYYLGSKKVADKKKKSGFSFIYILQNDKGNIGVWGKTDLDRKMQAAPVGAMVRITQSGMTPTPNGDMYKYQVAFDPENTITVLAVGYQAAEESYDNNEAEDNEEDSYTANTYENEVTSQKVALSASARTQQVEALLKGKVKRG